MEAYCGPAPVPSDLAWHWNPDAMALSLCAFLLCAGLWRHGKVGWPLAGATVWLLVLFVSPLCALTTALFSARATHHVLLVAVVCPLLALAFPARRAAPVALPAGIHALVLWFWHIPSVYAAAIGPAWLYWTMQLSLIASGVLLWRAILAGPQLGPSLLALGGTISQMGMLGALLTFAPKPLYAAHVDTTVAFGLSALDDQRLAGLIMWVPAALPYLVVGLILVAKGLAPDRQRPTMA